MTRAALLLELEALKKSEKITSQKLKALIKLEPGIEKKIIDGFKPVFDINTKAPLTKANILQRISVLADELMADDSIDYPVLLGVLNGALPFLKELYDRLKERGYACQYDALQASSYSGITSGELSVNTLLKVPVTLRHVVLVDDVCDTGKTAKKLIDLLMDLGAESVTLVVLVDKKQDRAPEHAVEPRYVCFTVSHKAFIAGWGMDWEELLRGYTDNIAAVDLDTLPKGGKLTLFLSKETLSKEVLSLRAEIKRVETALLQYAEEARPVSPGVNRHAMFALFDSDKVPDSVRRGLEQNPDDENLTQRLS